jgi:hypothetical protein
MLSMEKATSSNQVDSLEEHISFLATEREAEFDDEKPKASENFTWRMSWTLHGFLVLFDTIICLAITLNSHRPTSELPGNGSDNCSKIDPLC